MDISDRVKRELGLAKGGMSEQHAEQLANFRKFKARLQEAGVYKEDQYSISSNYFGAFPSQERSIK